MKYHLKKIDTNFHQPLPNIVQRLFADTGIIPETWTTGIIILVYKNKGCPTDPDNFRAITLISCLGKCLHPLKTSFSVIMPFNISLYIGSLQTSSILISLSSSSQKFKFLKYAKQIQKILEL
jgi:hypothetical protein